jgi:hypothetical protein
MLGPSGQLPSPHLGSNKSPTSMGACANRDPVGRSNSPCPRKPKASRPIEHHRGKDEGAVEAGEGVGIYRRDGKWPTTSHEP